MASTISPKTSPAASLRSRLVRVFLKRLWRRSRRQAIDRVVDLGLVEGGASPEMSIPFRLSPDVARWEPNRIVHALARGLGVALTALLHRDLLALAAAAKADADNEDETRGKDETEGKQKAAAPDRSSSAERSEAGLSEADSFMVEESDDHDAGSSGQSLPAATRRVAAEIAAARAGRDAKAATRSGSRPRDRSGSGSSSRTGASKAVLGLMRALAAPPPASDIAAMLMLADAVAASGVSLPRLLVILRGRTPVISVCGGVSGFERIFVRLLRHGLIVPHRIAVADGYNFTSPSDVTWRLGAHDHVRVILFRSSDDHGNHHADEQVLRAVETDYPVIGVADAMESLPASLVASADLHLECQPITPALLRETMRQVLGDDGGIGDHAFVDCAFLSLPDLSLAIRPGMTPDRALQLLHKAIERRKATPKTEAVERKPSSKSRSVLRGEAKATGSTIVQPDDLTADVGQSITTVETLSGYGEARDWALTLKDDLALWQAGDLAWEEMTTKLLLHGPPGTGKTTFAKALCNSLQIPLIATSVSTWLESGHLADVLSRMSAAFREAEASSPAILFIDEIDGLGRRVDMSRDYADYWNAIVNKALELLDGTAKQKGVIIVGATNNPGILDAALVRSGRLEKQIAIPLPDTEALAGILRHHLKDDLGNVVATAPEQKAPSAQRAKAGDATGVGKNEQASVPGWPADEAPRSSLSREEDRSTSNARRRPLVLGIRLVVLRLLRHLFERPRS